MEEVLVFPCPTPGCPQHFRTRGFLMQHLKTNKSCNTKRILDTMRACLSKERTAKKIKRKTKEDSYIPNPPAGETMHHVEQLLLCGANATDIFDDSYIDQLHAQVNQDPNDTNSEPSTEFLIPNPVEYVTGMSRSSGSTFINENPKSVNDEALNTAAIASIRTRRRYNELVHLMDELDMEGEHSRDEENDTELNDIAMEIIKENTTTEINEEQNSDDRIPLPFEYIPQQNN